MTDDEFTGRGGRAPCGCAAARAVLAVLQEAISPGEMQDLRAQLAQEWERLFAGSEGTMPPAN